MNIQICKFILDEGTLDIVVWVNDGHYLQRSNNTFISFSKKLKQMFDFGVYLSVFRGPIEVY